LALLRRLLRVADDGRGFHVAAAGVASLGVGVGAHADLVLVHVADLDEKLILFFFLSLLFCQIAYDAKKTLGVAKLFKHSKKGSSTRPILLKF
jgi:hypothetical protein